MKKITFILLFVFISFFTQSQTKHLFDGKSLDGWYMDVPKLEADSSERIPFIIRDGLLVSLGTPQGHLISYEEYDNYTLELDYRFAGKPGNCGVLVHASTPRALYDMFPKSIEVQLMHSNAGDFWCIEQNIEVDDMVARRGPQEEWGVNGEKKRRILNLTDDSEKPLGEWNHIKILCDADRVTVWLNGDLVNDGYNATASRGKIALQAEGAEVEFKNVFLTEN